MFCRISELKYKDVVSAQTGTRLGYVGDVEIDTQTAELKSVIIRGKYRLFGLLGREDDKVIPWDQIEVIGEDTILVNGEIRTRGRFLG